MVSLVRGARGHVGLRRRLLGYLVAPLDRARLVLDAGAPRHLCLRSAGWPVIRLLDPHRDVQPAPGTWRRRRSHLGSVGARRGVHLGLGRCRHAGVGAIRRLVAQRLRPRRQDHQSAAHDPGGRVFRHRARHCDVDAGVHEPGNGPGAPRASMAVPLRRRHGALRIAAAQA